MSGVVLFYLMSLLLFLVGARASPLAGGMLSVLVSALIVVIAAMKLLSDFDFVEKCVQSDLPKYMEWYAAFAVILSLIWLYTEALRLLNKAEKAKKVA